MRLPRLKLRTLIVLVALAAFAMGGVEFYLRSGDFAELAEEELDMETTMRERQAAFQRGIDMKRQLHPRKEDAALINRLIQDDFNEVVKAKHWADDHARRRAAYLRCARYPWLSPPVDDPKPRREI